jgi:nitrate reductase NapAB chaperone NapD
MPIAGAVIIPVNKGIEDKLKDRLSSLKGVKVEGIGNKGIAIVLEAEDTIELKNISEEILRWEEVISFELVYLNWE